MAQGTSFDVHVLSGEAAFVHRATAENTVGDETYLDDPLTNADPDATPSVTQNWNPGASGAPTTTIPSASATTPTRGSG